MRLCWNYSTGGYGTTVAMWLEQEPRVRSEGSVHKWFNKAVWKLLIEGKNIAGDITELAVELTEKEARVFELAVKSGADMKIAIWRNAATDNRQKEVVLEELLKALQVEYLKNKLETECEKG